MSKNFFIFLFKKVLTNTRHGDIMCMYHKSMSTQHMEVII